MKYRKLKKEYKRRFNGNSTYYKVYDKKGKTMKKASKEVTCYILKQCLKENKEALALLASEIRKSYNIA